MQTESQAPRQAWTGDELRLLRVSRRVTATAVARHYGATPQAITNVERTSRPGRATVARYLDALHAAIAEADR